MNDEKGEINMNLVKHNDKNFPLFNERWVIHFQDHKPLIFKELNNVKEYLKGNDSKEHSYIKYDRVPTEVSHTEYYDINWDD